MREWYEEKQPGLGRKFENEIFELIDYISRFPEHYARKRGNYREAVLRLFPYLIIYRIIRKEKLIVISSIFHSSRNPRIKYR
jgi:plasmid stabilization system protein ParE